LRKRELYKEIEEARLLYTKKDKDFAKYLVDNFRVDYVGDGTSIGIKFGGSYFWVDVNASRGELTVSEFSDNHDIIKKILHLIKEERKKK